MLRRHLLSAAAALPLAAGLAACSAVTAAVPQVVDDVNSVAAGLNGILPSLTTIAGVAAQTVTKIQGLVGEAQTIASQVGQVVSPSAATGLAGVVGDVVTALTGAALPPWAGAVLSAAQALLPVILTAAGVALAGPPPAMSAAQARAVLKAAAS